MIKNVQHVDLPNDTLRVMDVCIGALLISSYTVSTTYESEYDMNTGMISITMNHKVDSMGDLVFKNEDEIKNFILGKLPNEVVSHVKFIERKSYENINKG